MDFIIKEYNKNEFVSLLSDYCATNKTNMGQVEFDPNDQPDKMTKASIQDNVFERLSPQFIAKLQDI